MLSFFTLILSASELGRDHGLVVDHCGSPTNFDPNAYDYINTVSHDIIGCKVETSVDIRVVDDIGITDYTQRYGIGMRLLVSPVGNRSWTILETNYVISKDNRYFPLDGHAIWKVKWRLSGEHRFYYVRAMMIDRASDTDNITGICASAESGSANSKYRHFDNFHTMIENSQVCMEQSTVGVSVFFVFVCCIFTLIAYTVIIVVLRYVCTSKDETDCECASEPK